MHLLCYHGVSEITKDSASEGNFSEDDYLDGRRGARGHHGPGGGHYDPRGIPRSHAERGRPPPLPHERQRMDHHPPPPRGRDRIDDRLMYSIYKYVQQGSSTF